MVRLNKIKIVGFKDPSEVKELEFSKEPISVIYGENGSGKTTLLKILFAILSKDEKFLFQENISEIELEYKQNDENILLKITRNEENKYTWIGKLELCDSTSILFGVHRGVIQDKPVEMLVDKRRVHLLIDKLDDLINHSKYKFRNSDEFKYLFSEVNYELHTKSTKLDFKKMVLLLDRIIIHLKKMGEDIELNEIFRIREEFDFLNHSNTMQSEKINFLKKISNQSHVSTDFVKISEIQSAIVEQFNKGQGIVSDKIKRAFFETIENAVDIDETGQDFNLPLDFDQRIKAKKDFILKAIPKENSSLTERIKSYLETGNKDLTDKSKIFRAMLLNIIKSAEEPNPTLESITKLIEIFNEHLYRNKKLVVDTEKAYIDLGNDKFHSLSELSSGERNLLSLLTLFLIIGNERNFLIIDEPEISLNIKWQRDFLPLLGRLNSKAQIIVASHSPSIANRNSNYLVELK